MDSISFVQTQTFDRAFYLDVTEKLGVQGTQHTQHCLNNPRLVIGFVSLSSASSLCHTIAPHVFCAPNNQPTNHSLSGGIYFVHRFVFVYVWYGWIPAAVCLVRVFVDARREEGPPRNQHASKLDALVRRRMMRCTQALQFTVSMFPFQSVCTMHTREKYVARAFVLQ